MHSENPNAIQMIVIERDLDLVLLKRNQPSVYAMAGTLGGVAVVLYLLGACLVSCLTIGAYEDHVV